MQNTTLLSLQRQISKLGLGTVKLGRDQQVKYPHAFVIPDKKQALALLNCAAELGINIIDTAPAYGNSEQRLGELLPATGHDWVVISKAGEEFIDGQSYFDFSADALVASVERSLKALCREAIDVLLIHSNGDDVSIINNYDVFGTIQDLKQQGKIIAGGMSVKTHEGALLTLEQSDILMYELSLYAAQQSTDIFDYALEKNKQIFIKKALTSGHLLAGKNPEQTIRRSFSAAFSYPSVATIIVGTINPQHLATNVRIADEVIVSHQAS